MKNHEIHAAIIRIQSEQLALYPEIPIEYYSLYRHKPREPAQTGTIRNDPKQNDIPCVIGRTISRIIKKRKTLSRIIKKILPR